MPSQPEYVLKDICWQCQGSGVASIPTPEGEKIIDPCNVCDGEGYRTIGYLFAVD